MIALKHILVPTDFGEPADRALDLAITLAAKFDSELTLFHAYMIPTMGYGDGLYWPIDDLQRAAKDALNAAVAKAKERYPKTKGLLAVGEPWREILEAARQGGVDFIVMGTHGRRGLTRVLLGSVAEKLVRLSPVPVVTVPAGPRITGEVADSQKMTDRTP